LLSEHALDLGAKPCRADDCVIGEMPILVGLPDRLGAGVRRVEVEFRPTGARGSAERPGDLWNA
jgi:hypothetical protein